MKKIAILFLALIMIGCGVKTTTTTVPPAPTVTGCKLLASGACDPVDVNAFRVIADAYSVLNSINNSIKSGGLVLSPAQVTVFHNLVASYNATYILGQAYHNGTSTDSASLNTATSNLSNNLTAATNQIGVQ